MEIRIEEEDNVIAFRASDLVSRLGTTYLFRHSFPSPSQYRSEHRFFCPIPSEVIKSIEPVYPGMRSKYIVMHH
jgi:hypothetical protein